MSLDLKKLEKNTLWRGKQKSRFQFFCPICQLERRIPFYPRPDTWRHYFQVGLSALVFTFACFPFFRWRGVVSFVPFWAIFEIIFRLQMRSKLSCPHCGFDPYLFLRDAKKGREVLEAHLKKKFQPPTA